MGLACQSCGYDNDPTRVFCHNCAARLVSSGGGAPPSGFTPAPQLQAARQKPTRGLPWAELFRAGIRLLVPGLLLAALVLAFLEPVGVPPPADPLPEAEVAAVDGLLRDSSSVMDGSRSFALPVEKINGYLAAVVRPAAAGGDTWRARPQRAYVVGGEGNLRLGLEIALPVGRMFLEETLQPEIDGQGSTLRVVAAHLGRLPVHPLLAGWIDVPLQRLAGALHPQVAALGGADSVKIGGGQVTLQWVAPASP